MERNEIIRWIYEHRNLQEMYKISLDEQWMMFHSPQCISIKVTSIDCITEYPVCFIFETLHGAVTIYKNLEITQVTVW